MYVVTGVNDDYTYEILDLGMYIKRDNYTFNKIKILLKNGHTVIGVTGYNNEILNISAVNLCEVLEEELSEYLIEHNLNSSNVLKVDGKVFVVTHVDKINHVEFRVYYQEGDTKTFICEDATTGKKGVTPYENGAKIYIASAAYKLAIKLTETSKTGKHWFVDRKVLH